MPTETTFRRCVDCGEIITHERDARHYTMEYDLEVRWFSSDPTGTWRMEEMGDDPDTRMVRNLFETVVADYQAAVRSSRSRCLRCALPNFQYPHNRFGSVLSRHLRNTGQGDSCQLCGHARIGNYDAPMYDGPYMGQRYTCTLYMTRGDSRGLTTVGNVTCCERCARTLHECGACGHVGRAPVLPDGSGCSECVDVWHEIESYNYKPLAVINGNPKADGDTFGVELEFHVGHGEYDHTVLAHLFMAEMWKRGYGPDQVYLKHDGSIMPGFEVVLHPFTLREFKRTKIIPAIYDAVATVGRMCNVDIMQRTLEHSCCGLHIHVGKKGLGRVNVLKAASLIYGNVALATHFGGRELNQYCNGQRPDGGLVYLLRRQGGNKYALVNLSPKHTMEFRFFRNVSCEWTEQAIAFIGSILDYVRTVSLNEVNMKGWLHMVRGHKRYATVANHGIGRAARTNDHTAYMMRTRQENVWASMQRAAALRARIMAEREAARANRVSQAMQDEIDRIITMYTNVTTHTES